MKPWYISAALCALLWLPALAQAGQPAGQARRERLKAAATPEARKAVIEEMRKTSRGAAQAKPETPAQAGARHQKREEALKKDPERWQMYQLRQALRSASTDQERENIRRQLAGLSAKRAAAAETAQTPEQRAARARREADREALQRELAPLRERLHTAGSAAERDSLREAIRQVSKKYLRGR